MRPRKKRKNAGVGIDFQRAKRKVGRQLPKKPNKTDTTIQSRTIYVPGQSVTAEREGKALSKRQLSLKVSKRTLLLFYSPYLCRSCCSNVGITMPECDEMRLEVWESC